MKSKLTKGRPLDLPKRGRTKSRSVPIPDEDWLHIKAVAKKRKMSACELVRLGAIRECERTPDEA